MARLEIQGGQRLSGRVRAAGAKNSVIKLMAASILFEEPIALTNVPHLRDVKTMASLLEYMGATCVWNGSEGLSIAAGSLAGTQAPYHLVRTMRASFNVLGPLLARYGQAEVSLPGGCAIGTRPVDQHLAGLAALGASVTIESGYVRASAEHGLIGTDFSFDFPSVGATEHVLMAAVLAKGQTRLSGCAREPEIVDLAAFLNQAGARIRGAGTSEIEINGVGSLAPINYEVMSDRIEAATYLMAAIATGGEVAVDGLTVDHLPTVVELLRATGVTVEKDKNAVAVSADAGALIAQSFDTAPFPGFPTDLQAQMMVVNSLASGRSHIRETIFENRFMHVQELARMGAKITLQRNNSVARVEGARQLKGAPVMATDLRASACLVIAGLAAEGTTIIDRIYHLDRGYAALEHKLTG
ncbi:MAG: UDP-N-acetylglucosamine 1-carboxyvinyltransferase, partial [Gammaproteobacteria bacterium]|nr:UDP-N-acetylglucosamine 1-carboxyvinyltransferase [Gammaproteobacteria bacterium]